MDLVRKEAFRLLHSLEKSSNSSAVRYSECLVALVAPIGLLPLSDEDAKNMVLRLKVFLLHKSPPIVENVAQILVRLTEQKLPLQVSLSLINQVSNVFDGLQSNLADCRGSILDLLTNLVSSDEMQEIFGMSRCFNQIVQSLCNMNPDDYGALQNLEYIINVLISSASQPKNPQNIMTIMKDLAPLVTKHLLMWINNNPNASRTQEKYLKEILFLAREIMYNHTPCQNLFFKHQGLETLKKVLITKHLMECHMIIEMPMRESVYIDHSQTLFSSILMILYASLVGNRKTCLKAYKLNFIGILKQYLHVSPVKQQGFLISSIVLILHESGLMCQDQILINDMYTVVTKETSIDVHPSVVKFLQENSDRNTCSVKKIAGTPHPRKMLMVTTSPVKDRFLQKNSDRHTYSVKKRASTPHPRKMLMATTSPEKDRVNEQILETLEINSPPTHHEMKASSPPLPSKFKKFFVSTAELIVFMNCIRVHGANMQAVRRVWPFHKELTPGDLYAIWRAIWKKRH